MYNKPYESSQDEYDLPFGGDFRGQIKDITDQFRERYFVLQAESIKTKNANNKEPESLE